MPRGPATMRLHRRKSEGCSVILISKFLDEVWRLLLNAFAHGERALQGKARNLVFTHECDAWMALSVCDEFFQHLCARGTSRNAVMGAHRHHATPHGGFGIEHVELGLQVAGILLR